MLVVVLSGLPAMGRPRQGSADPLDPLYQRIAHDLRRGKPLVITVHPVPRD